MTAPADSRISDERLAHLLKWAPYHGLPGQPITPADSYLEDPDEIYSILSELTELRERRAQAVRVKPLEWEEAENEDGVYWLEAAPFRYEVYHKAIDVAERGVQLVRNGEILGFFPTTDAAKDTAQADYAATIAHAAPPPAQAAGVTVTDEMAERAVNSWPHRSASPRDMVNGKHYMRLAIEAALNGVKL